MRQDELGGPDSHGAYPAAWAYATATPFTYGKGVTSGGGLQHLRRPLLAGAHHRPRRRPPPGPSPRRHHPDHPGEHRRPGADARQRRRPEADGGREHALHLRRRGSRGPPHDAVLRAHRHPRDRPRRLVGRHAPRPGRPGRLGQDGVVRRGRLGALRHDHGLRPRHRPGGRAPREARRAAGHLRPRGPQVQRLPTRRQPPRAAVRRAPEPRLRQQGQLPPGHHPDPRGRRHQHQEPLVHAHRGDRELRRRR